VRFRRVLRVRVILAGVQHHRSTSLIFIKQSRSENESDFHGCLPVGLRQRQRLPVLLDREPVRNQLLDLAASRTRYSTASSSRS